MRKLLLCLLILIFPLSAISQEKSNLPFAPLDFSSSINKIISRSTDISLAELNSNVIKAKNIPARFTFFPTLSLTGIAPISDNYRTLPQTIELTSRWNLFRWGADYFGLLAAISSEVSQKYAVDATVIVTEQAAVSALIMEIQKQKEVGIYLNIVKSQTELLEIAQQRYKRGLLPLQEVEKLMIDLANAKASLVNSKMSETQARANLESLLGQTNIVVEWPWIDEFKKGKGKSIVKEELQLKQIPDWVSAQKDVESQNDRLSQNWRTLLPSIDAQVSWGHYNGYFGSFTGWVGTVTMSVPLFDGLASYSNAKAQSYLKATSETKMVQVQRTAKSQWQASRVNFQTALETALARDEALNLSKKLYRDNLRRLQTGKITANDLTIDRTRMNSAELFAIQGWAAVHINFADLCHSLGYRVSTCLKL